MNADRLFARMKQDGLDAIVATMPENVTYASGFWAMSQWIRRGPQAYVLVPGEKYGPPAVMASTGLIDLVADDEVWVKDVRRYGNFVIDRAAGAHLDAWDTRIDALLAQQDDGDAVACLVRAIKDRRLESGRIGVDEICILPQYWDKLADALPNAKLVRAANVFRYARSIKTPEEIARLSRRGSPTSRSKLRWRLHAREQRRWIWRVPSTPPRSTKAACRFSAASASGRAVP